MEDKPDTLELETVESHVSSTIPWEKTGDDAAAEHNDQTENFHWNALILLNLLALFLCYFASTWGLVGPNSSIAFIVEKFPEDAGKSAWIAAAVTVPNCVLQAFMGELSDIFGRKYFLIVGMTLGVVGTIVSGCAKSIEMVIGGQVLNGCGLTLGYLAIPLVSEIVPKDRRPVIQGIAGLTAGVAQILAPIVAGCFVKHNVGGALEGWRGVFYLSAAFYFTTLIFVFFSYNPGSRPNPEGLSLTRRALRIDWIGVFLLIAGLVLFLVGLDYGGNPYSWTDAIVLVPLLIGASLIITLILFNWRFNKEGLLHHSLFEHRNFGLSAALNFVGGIILFGGQSYLPQEIQALFTSDAVMTGVYNIPFNSFTIISALIGGLIMTRTKEAKWLVVTACAAFLVGGGLMAVMQPHINYAAYFFPTALLGLGVGIVMSILLVVVSICTANEHIAHAMSLIASIRALGGSIGIVIFQAVYNSRATNYLAPRLAKAVLAAGLPQQELTSFLQAASSGANASQLLELSGVTPGIIKAFESAQVYGLADCYRYIWYSFIPFAVVILILSFFLKSRKEQMTRQVVAVVHKIRGHYAHRRRCMYSSHIRLCTTWCKIFCNPPKGSCWMG